jgi:hypothetical protein
VGPVTLKENYGFSARDLTRTEYELEENLDVLLSAWEEIHGDR